MADYCDQHMPHTRFQKKKHMPHTNFVYKNTKKIIKQLGLVCPWFVN